LVLQKEKNVCFITKKQKIDDKMGRKKEEKVFLLSFSHTTHKNGTHTQKKKRKNNFSFFIVVKGLFLSSCCLTPLFFSLFLNDRDLKNNNIGENVCF
jgi:hypothetical protein